MLADNAERVNKRRDYCIDYLRTVGIFLIILAHCFPPDWLKCIRIFDVVLLVFASGMSYTYSKDNMTFKSYCFYVWKRIKRLLFPAWGFVSIYLFYLLILNLNGANYSLSFSNVFFSFTLVDGVGYVWIVRIFLCMAVIAPFIKKVSGQISNDGIYIAMIIAFGTCYLFILHICQQFNYGGHIKTLIDTCLLPIFGYVIVYAVGMRCRQMKNLFRIFIMAILIIIIGYWCCITGFNYILSDKYPPGPLYLSYGLTCSILLFYIFRNLSKNIFVTWVSKNSLEAYYIHCFIIAFMDAFLPNLWFLWRYVIALVFTFTILALYVKIRTSLLLKIKKS